MRVTPILILAVASFAAACGTSARSAPDLAHVPAGGSIPIADVDSDSAPIHLDANRPTGACQVHLERTVPLRIRVTGDDGAPRTDAWVTMKVSWGEDTATRAETPAGNEWTFGRVLPGTYDVQVNAPGLRGERRSVTVAGADEVIADFRLAPGANLTGVVVSTAGEPVANVDVRFSASDTRHTVKTAADGTFRIDGLPDAAGTLQIFEPAGFRSFLQRKVAPGAEPIRIVLAPLSSIRGRFAPVPSSRRVLYHGPGGSTTGWKRRKVDVADDGGFQVDGIDGGRAFDLLLWPDGGACHVLRGTSLRPGETLDLGVLDASPDAAVTGTVTDARGEPVPGATVHADQFPVAQELRVRTDSQGRFVLPLHRSARATLAVAAEGFATTYVLHEAVGDRAGGAPGGGRPAAPPPLALVVTRGCLVTGTITDAAGAPAPDGWVEFFEDGGGPGRWAVMSRGGAGRFELRVPAGRYRPRTWIAGRSTRGPALDAAEGGSVETTLRVE